MSEELKLQAAPLMALQLELVQARLDTETMRVRLKEDRKESRLRYAGQYEFPTRTQTCENCYGGLRPHVWAA